MRHGIDAYFAEIERFRERMARFLMVTSLIAAVLFGLPLLLLLTPLAPKIRPIMRFGFEGPEKIVRTIKLIGNQGPAEGLRNVGKVVAIPSPGSSGGTPTPKPGATRPASRGKGKLPGFDDSHLSLVQRALASEGRTPIFQSEELIIEHLVKPIYPDDVRDRGIEGKVAVMALVDTTGHVVEVEVMTGSGEFRLDQAATDAVSLCRFRPYRVAGIAQEVYAVFRFAFRIY